jgi:hypothetical protein
MTTKAHCRRTIPTAAVFLLCFGAAGCRTTSPGVVAPTSPGVVAPTSPRVVGPTLPLPPSPETLPAGTPPATYANRAWSSKPGLLAGLLSLGTALQSNLHLSKLTATKLVVVTSALNQCLY